MTLIANDANGSGDSAVVIRFAEDGDSIISYKQ